MYYLYTKNLPFTNSDLFAYNYFNKKEKACFVILTNEERLNKLLFKMVKNSYDLDYIEIKDFNNIEENLIDLDNILSIGKKVSYSNKKVDGSEFYLDFEYIDKNDCLEGREFHFPLIELNFFTQYQLFFASKVRKMVNLHRYLHMISVANNAFNVANNNQVDPYIAYMAGYYHDITRENKISENYFKEVDEKFAKYFKGKIPLFLYHQFTAPLYLEKEYKINNKEVLKAINFHTTGSTNMSKLDKIIFAVDKIEPNRDFISKDFYLDLIENIDSGFQMVLKANKEYLEAQKSYSLTDENLLTLSCYKAYLEGKN